MKIYTRLMVLLLTAGVLGHWYRITRIDTIGISCGVVMCVIVVFAIYLILHEEK